MEKKILSNEGPTMKKLMQLLGLPPMVESFTLDVGVGRSARCTVTFWPAEADQRQFPMGTVTKTFKLVDDTED